MTPLFIPAQFDEVIKVSFKVIMLMALIVYGLFALIMTRQVDLMARSLSTKHEGLMRLLTYLHVGLVVLFGVVVLVWL